MEFGSGFHISEEVLDSAEIRAASLDDVLIDMLIYQGV
jgi:hypothetical protein